MSKNSGESAVSRRQFFSAKRVFSPRSLAVMGVMAALAAILSRFTIYITPTFKGIGFAYLPAVVVPTLLGPWAGLAFALVSDTVGFFANPQGGYFPGYAISEMLSCFLYACFLYRRPIRIWRIAAARLLVLVFITLGLNFVWSSMLFGSTAGTYFVQARFLNNLVQYPFHIALIFGLLKVMERAKLMEQFQKAETKG
jgi:ECF transporter S component (folate family)